MSHSANTTGPTARRSAFGIVSTDGSIVASATSLVNRVTPGHRSQTKGLPNTPIANPDSDWDARFERDSTCGDAKPPAIVSGKIFSNAVNEYFVANPNHRALLAMAVEFEQAFVEAAKNPS